MLLKKIAIVLLACGIVLLFFSIAFSTVFQNKDCLRCHDDPKLVISWKNALPQTNRPTIADYFLLSSNLIKQEISQLRHCSDKIEYCEIQWITESVV